MSLERTVYLGTAGLTVVVAIATILVDGTEPELTLMMLGAVCAGLVQFDVSMNRRLRSFRPWVLLSIAPAAKTVPSVWNQLFDNEESAASFDQAGSVLFATFVFLALLILSRPSAELPVLARLLDRLVILGSATVSAIAGASLAFLFDPAFGSITSARLFETASWFLVGALLAAAVLSAARSEVISESLFGVLIVAVATAALLAITAAGSVVDNGWWTVLFAGLTISATIPVAAVLDQRLLRVRRSTVGSALALVVGLVAAGSAIVVRSDGTAWSPGWQLLGVLSLAMFGLAMAIRPTADEAVTPGRVAKRVESPR